MDRMGLRGGMSVPALGLGLAFAFLTAGDALAQACMGNPAGQRQVAFAAAVGFTDGARAYGGSVTGNLMGPMSVSGSFGLIDYDGIDATGKSIGASTGYEIGGVQFSMCPTAGLGYSWISEDDGFGNEASLSTFVVPIGVGFGKVMSAGRSLYVTPYGVPQLLWMHSELEVSDGINTIEFSDDTAEFGARLGVLLGSRSVYGGGEVSFTTIDESDPVFALQVGVVF